MISEFNKSEFNNYLKKNKKGLIFYFLVLLLLIVALVGRYYYLGIYPISLFLIYLLFFNSISLKI